MRVKAIGSTPYSSSSSMMRPLACHSATMLATVVTIGDQSSLQRLHRIETLRKKSDGFMK